MRLKEGPQRNCEFYEICEHACFASFKERGIFMCSVLVLADGLKNEEYSFVARLFRLMD